MSALTTTGRHGSAASLRSSGGEAPNASAPAAARPSLWDCRGNPRRTSRPAKNCLTKLSCMYYLCSQQTGERRVSGSVEAVAPAAPCDRSIGAENAASRREEGTRKEFRRRVADNALISPNSPPKMEGIGSDLRRFGSSRTRPGRVFEITGAPPRGECGIRARRSPKRRSLGLQMAPQWLEKIDSAPGDGMAPQASNPQDLRHAPLETRPPAASAEALARGSAQAAARRLWRGHAPERILAWARLRRRPSPSPGSGIFICFGLLVTH